MIKKIISITILICCAISSKVFAEDKSINNTMYEVKNKAVELSIEEDTDLPEEVKSNFGELGALEYLIPKTNSEYELVKSKNNGEYEFISDFSNLNEAMEKANELEEILKSDGDQTAIINQIGQIVYSPNAMGKIIKYVDGKPYPSNNKNTDIHKDANLNSVLTYVNHGYVDDVPIIKDNGLAAKIQVAGAKGWVNKDSSKAEYDMIIVPLNQVSNPSYYKNENGELTHFISSNISGEKGKGHKISIGRAPSFMQMGKEYYSSDYKYFYENLEVLISDLKGGHNNNSVNANNEFYSYYLYLPFRSNGSFTGKELDDFILRNTQEHSKLRGVGQALLYAERVYGVNSLTILSVAINESNWGLSKIAQEKNNIFGINAVDSDPNHAANEFASVSECINEFAKNYISKGYSDPDDWRYSGGHLGNKELGANVRYASDPYWGEKATKYMYQVDKGIAGTNLREFNSKTIGVHNDFSQIIDKNGELLYEVNNNSKAGKIGSTIVVNGYDKNEEVYNVNAHRTTPVSQGEFHGEYNWSGDSMIAKDKIKVINRNIENYESGINYRTFIENNGWSLNSSNGEVSGTSGQAKKIEGLKINLKNTEISDIQYRVHIEDLGWQEWKNNNEVAGAPNSGKRIEAIEIKSNDTRYVIEYRTHIEDIGWQEWKSNGELSGTTGLSKRIEAIEIRIKEKISLSNLEYRTHIQNEGWQDWVKDNKFSGTEGEAKRLEAIKIKIDGLPNDNYLRYKTHIQDIGWQEWKNNGELSGTEGESKRLEAIQIDLDDNIKHEYKIEYRVHIQDIGWQEWKTNGEVAGTSGLAKRLEAIQIKLVKI